jgi:hypothetical protein
MTALICLALTPFSYSVATGPVIAKDSQTAHPRDDLD